MTNNEIQAEMYSNLRIRVKDEISADAKINDIKVRNNVQGSRQYLSFMVTVEVFEKIIVGQGATENEIIESLKLNRAEQYSPDAERVNYTPCDAAVTTCV